MNEGWTFSVACCSSNQLLKNQRDMRGAGLIVWTFSAACCCASSLLAPFPVSLTCRLSQRAFRFISLSHYNELVIQNKENNHHLFAHITVSFNYLPLIAKETIIFRSQKSQILKISTTLTPLARQNMKLVSSP